MISSGGQIKILGSDQAQETLGDGELLERDLRLGEVLDLVRLGLEEDQSQQINELQQRGQTEIL